MRSIIGIIFTCALAYAQGEISGEHIRAHLRFLSSDLLEGRGVGTRGGELAASYIATQFELAGLKPGGENGTFYQRVDLVGVEPQATSSLAAAANGKRVEFHWLTDFVGNTMVQKTAVPFDAEAVFVGHGISAPEFGWDDYAGADVKGKVVVLFTNEPPSDDPKFFGAKALTYYGRWTYKFEEAARRGAVGCLILHTTPTAGYGWDVVRGSWSKEDPQVKLGAAQTELSIAAWLSQDAAGRLLALAGKNVDEMLTMANTKGFQAMPLGILIRGEMRTKIREIHTANVAGLVPGSDPVLGKQVVIFSAHWDHLGVGVPVDGDAIYNGAVDNASGCAMLLEMARAWAKLERRPKRSALFLAVTAEESGLRGSEYYATHPLIPNRNAVLNLNFDAFYPFGRTKDVVVAGSERTTAYPVVEAVAKQFNLTIKPDPRPEQGEYYRSDHFSFAHVGVPAFSINMGDEYYGKPAGAGAKIFEEYNDKHYHRPSDEYKEDWDMAGMEQFARFGYTIGLTIANSTLMPSWHTGDEFLPAREASPTQP